MTREKSLILAMLALLLILFLSAIHPYDRTTWFMEVAPIFIALPIMIATCRRFPLTTLLYVLIFIHTDPHHGRLIHLRARATGLLDSGYAVA